MKRFLVLGLIVVLVGCATTKKETALIKETNQVREDSLIVIEHNVGYIVDAYAQRTLDAYNQGLAASYDAVLKNSTDKDGNVPAKLITNLTAEMQKQMTANQEAVHRERDDVKQTMAGQFAVVRKVDKLQSTLTESGDRITPALFNELTSAMNTALVTADPTKFRDAEGKIDWAEVVAEIGKQYLQNRPIPKPAPSTPAPIEPQP